LKTDFQKLTAWKQKGSARITALDLRHKALRGESQEHFKHETRLKVVKGDERQDGNQTMQAVLAAMAVAALLKLFTAEVL
jgi:hypothetical protein